ncbi:hypothetical protein AO265_39860 [Pseudomonas sp. ABAC61]|nr:hypothetical protein AO265_39860 [Pseudomonas sp. ABAC61]
MNIDKERLKALAEAAQNDSGDYAALNDYGMAVPPTVTLALLAEIEALRESANFRAVQSLRADCEALRKDAERYWWLRDKSESVHSFYLSVPIWFSGVRFRKDDVDSAIDAAKAQAVQP